MTIRVAVVARSVFPLHGVGGLERHVYDLLRYLAETGIDTTLITKAVASARRVDPAAIHPLVTIRTVPYRTFPLAGRRGTTVLDRSTAYPVFGERAGRLAWQLVKDGSIDVVHGLGASVLGYARRRRKSTAPLVLNPQGLEEFGATDPGRARLKRAAYLPLRRAVLTCARAADAVIATDRVLEPAVRAHLGVPAERVHVIPNALDLGWADSLATAADGLRVRRAAGIEAGDTVIVSVGRLEENKGFHILAAALGALREHGAALAHARWRWVIVGDGPFRPQLTRAIGDAGIAGQTKLLGRLEDRELHAWYEAATLFAHPTLYEGSSLVTLEAMAHRRAIVATAAGGLPDKVENGANGWLVPPGDASALAAALSGAIGGPPERLAAMGARSRAIVEDRFSWTAAGAKTVRLYRQLLAAGT